MHSLGQATERCWHHMRCPSCATPSVGFALGLRMPRQALEQLSALGRLVWASRWLQRRGAAASLCRGVVKTTQKRRCAGCRGGARSALECGASQDAVPAVTSAQGWRQLCFSCAMPQRDTRCPGFGAVPAVPGCHQLFSAVFAGGAAGEQVLAAGTAAPVVTSCGGERGRSCWGGWGCAGGSALRAGLTPGDLLLLHIRPDSAPTGDGSQAPTDCAGRRIWPFPAFPPSFQARTSGRVGKVSRGDQLNVYPPLWHGNAASTLIFMRCNSLQLPAGSPGRSQPSPSARHRLGRQGKGHHSCSATALPVSGRTSLPCTEGMEGRHTGHEAGLSC